MAGDKIPSNLINDARWHARLAALLTASGKHESAAAHYRRALRGLEGTADDDPENEAQRQGRRLQWQFELAATEIKRGQRQDAILLYETILRTDPEYVEAQVNLAAQLAIADASRLEEALELCMRALALRPDFAEAHYNRNMLLRRLGRQREAIDVYWEYITRDLGADIAAGVVLQADGRLSRVPQVDKANCTHGDYASYALESDENSVAVVCVKWGTKYGAEYVNRLYNSVMRHCGQVHLTFVCLTDDTKGIERHANLKILSLDDGWKGWWNKCQLFSSALSMKLQALGHSRCLYLDLDTVIVGSLVDLLLWSPPSGVLALLKTDEMTNEQREGGYNSSIMLWRIEVDEDALSLRVLFSFLHAHFAVISKYIYKFDHWLEMAPIKVSLLEDTFPDQFVEYRSLDKQAVEPPPHAAIVCFPLIPKPHQATAPWISQHWV